MFKKAEKTKQKLRLLIDGASGSGKTYSALRVATGLGEKIALIDTEKGSASLYADKFNFDVAELNPPYTPESYIKVIEFAESANYDTIIIDSSTHEWSGKGGCLEIHAQLGGQFNHWLKVTPRHNAFVNAITSSKCHIIACCRAKSDYDISKEGGKTKVEKVGLATNQRPEIEFEFTIQFRLNQNHLAIPLKDRTELFIQNEVTFEEILTEKTGERLLEWLNSGKEPEKNMDYVNETLNFLKTSGLTTNELLKEFCEESDISSKDQDSLRFVLDNKEMFKLTIDNFLADRGVLNINE